MNAVPIYLGVVVLAQAAPGSLSELLRNPERFDGQSVVVNGTISNVRESGWRRPIYSFELSEGTQTVQVVGWGKPPCPSGAVTVQGTFEEIGRPPRVSHANERIWAVSVTCLPDQSAR
jgi:hypothetical protein